VRAHIEYVRTSTNASRRRRLRYAPRGEIRRNRKADAVIHGRQAIGAAPAAKRTLGNGMLSWRERSIPYRLIAEERRQGESYVMAVTNQNAPRMRHECRATLEEQPTINARARNGR